MSNTQTITLGDRSFEIPELPLGVMRKIWPISARMSLRAKAAKATGDQLELVKATSSPDNIDDAIEIVFLGISFGTPSFKREELDNIICDLNEIIIAALIVSMQAGGKKEGDKPAGEPLLEVATPPIQQSQIGIESSPISAATPDGSGTTSSGPSPLEN